jgi:PAS domain S-box-containing protein
VAILLLAVATGMTGTAYLKYQTAEFRRGAEQTLSSVAELKTGQISGWYSERRSDAEVVLRNPMIMTRLRQLLSAPPGTDSAVDIQAWMEGTRELYRFHRLVLYDARGVPRLHAPAGAPGSGIPPLTGNQDFLAAMRNGSVQASDLRSASADPGHFCLDFWVPVPSAPGAKAPAPGVVLLDIDPDQALFPLIQSWPTPSRTAETLLIRREGNDVVFLNRLRHRSDDPLAFRMPMDSTRHVPAVMAALGREGIVSGPDYRGVPVLAAVRGIPGTPWFMVAKQDLTEIDAPLRARVRAAGLVLLLIFVAAAMGVNQLARARDVKLLQRQIAAELGRRRLEEALQHQQEFAHILLENIVAGVVACDAEGKLSVLNRTARVWHGLDATTVPQEEWASHYDLYLEDGQTPMTMETVPLARAFRGETVCDAGMVICAQGQPPRQIVANCAPLRDAQGHLLGAVAVMHDITERRRAEEELRKLASVVRYSSELVNLAALDGKMIFLNEAGSQMLGIPPAEVDQINIMQVIPAHLREKVETELLPSVMGCGTWVGDLQYLNLKTGRLTDVRATTFVIKDQATGAPLYLANVSRDITESKRAEEALLEANRSLQESTDRANDLAVQAEQATRAKSEFLANMSHEIRTPMNGVIGMTGLLLDTELNEEQRRYAEIVRGSGESLLAILNDILDFSKIEAGKLEMETLDFDLPALLDDFAATVALRAHDHGVELICAAAPDVPACLRGDPGRLRQVLTNLVGNAVKFTHQGEIAVRVSLTSETESEVVLRFSVNDTGTGILAEKQDLLFQKFTQADTSTTRRHGGTGLGLAISKQLVEMMGGRIGIESEEGRGSEFWFTARYGKQTDRAQTGGLPLADIRGTHLLIVDDNATNREVLMAQLQAWGIRSEEVPDGPAALRELRRARDAGDPFQGAIVDMQMPGMDGAELARAIKADGTLQELRLVLMTSLGQRGDARKMEEAGFAAYLTKPVRQSQIIGCLSVVLAGAGAVEPAPPIVTRHAIRELRRGVVRILLAEDNITNQQVAVGLLKRLGLRADAVANGAEAIKALETLPYDLVLMDVQMPEMGGLEATRQIRDPESAVRNHEVPIIAMTANAMQSDRDECLDAGMNDYVSKPVSPKALAEALDRWLPREATAATEPSPGERGDVAFVSAQERDARTPPSAGTGSLAPSV